MLWIMQLRILCLDNENAAMVKICKGTIKLLNVNVTNVYQYRFKKDIQFDFICIALQKSLSEFITAVTKL